MGKDKLKENTLSFDQMKRKIEEENEEYYLNSERRTGIPAETLKKMASFSTKEVQEEEKKNLPLDEDEIQKKFANSGKKRKWIFF